MNKSIPHEVPTYDIQEFFEKKNTYCICVFVINEGEKVQKQLRKMKPYADMVDIIIADGGSTDGSLAENFLKENTIRTLLTKTGKGKLSAQMRMAFDYAMKQGYEGIITVDGNNKDDISAIPFFIEKLDEGFDHIQGSRFIPGGVEENTPLARLIAVRLIHTKVISLAAGEKHTDTTNGFRAYSKKLLEDPRVQPFRDIFQTYELHYYLAIRSSKLGFKTTEIPVKRSYPKKGKTPTKISPFKGNLHIMNLLRKAFLKHYNPKQ